MEDGTLQPSYSGKHVARAGGGLTARLSGAKMQPPVAFLRSCYTEMNTRGTSVAGGWLGTYEYRGLQAWHPPVRFEATFTLRGSQGRFTGTILDDGPLGEAGVNGSQHGLYVSFTKVYLRPGHEEGATCPIEYEGTLSEDGRSLTGVWQLKHPARGRRTVRVHGACEAHGLWSETAEAEAARTEGAGALLEAVAAPGATAVTKGVKTAVELGKDTGGVR